MIARLHRFALLALYQTTLAVGLFMLPVAIGMKRIGVSLPLHHLLARVEHAYEARSSAE